MFEHFLVHLTVYYYLCHLQAHSSDWEELYFLRAMSGLIPFFLCLQKQENS